MNIIGIIGLGLIGGSIGLKLKNDKIKYNIIGSDNNKKNTLYAMNMGIVDEIVSINELIEKSSIIIISIPVNSIEKILPKILDKISENTVVFDTGSTKFTICNNVLNHYKRGRFVATHPIAGIENSGPYFAQSNLFYNRNCIICDSNMSDYDAILITRKIYSIIGIGNIYYISSKEHDLYISYVSHLPHVISFALSNTIIKKFKDKKEIFKNMAGSGYYSTTRLSKSNHKTWLPILKSNKKNLIKSINFYIDNLNLFRDNLLKNKFIDIDDLIKKANNIVDNNDKKYV